MNIENSDPDPGQEIHKYLKQYLKLIRDGNAPFPLVNFPYFCSLIASLYLKEFWNPLQLACSIGNKKD